MLDQKKNKGLPRILKAFTYSWDGLKATFETEAAFRQELVLALISIPLAFALSLGTFWIVLIISAVILVLIVELINTAIEVLVERISPGIHPLSKKAKDIGSAAVLLSLINLGIIWLFALFY